MPNMCICGHHYASHEGYNALEGVGGGACMGESRKCQCKEYQHRTEDSPAATGKRRQSKEHKKRGGAA